MSNSVTKPTKVVMESGPSPRSRQTGPMPAKKPLLTPQGERVKARFIAGDSVRKIAREEQISREKVTHIIRSEDVQAYIREMRELFFGLGHLALSAVRNALEGRSPRVPALNRHRRDPKCLRTANSLAASDRGG
jgi:hypothetical protein